MLNMDTLKVEIEDLSQVKKKLSVTVAAEVVKEEVSEAYRSLRSGVNIPGFRKGNVPMNILKSRFGDHVRDDVSKKIIETTYPHAMHEKGLVPVAPPHIEVKKNFSETDEFSYMATVEVNPTVAVDGYMGLELTKKPVEVSDKDVEDAIDKIRQAKAEFKDVERPAEDGDLVVTDYDATMDGKPIKNGKASDVAVLMGQKTPLPGYDEALKGASKGDVRTADITFPANISLTDLAGKTAQFAITIKAVKSKTTPALDDEFAKDLECESLQNLRERVRKDLIAVKELEEKERLKNEILDKLIEKHAFDVPEALVNRYQAILLNKVAENMGQGVFAPGDEGLSVDQLKEKYLKQAARHVKEDIILDTVAAIEKVDVSQAEVDDAIKKLADQRKISFDALMTRIQQEGALEVIKDGLKHEKVFDVIIAASKTAA